MAPTSDAEWERWRNAIHTLYVVEKKPLEGKHGVMGIMKEKYNFQARFGPSIPSFPCTHFPPPC